MENSTDEYKKIGTKEGRIKARIIGVIIAVIIYFGMGDTIENVYLKVFALYGTYGFVYVAALSQMFPDELRVGGKKKGQE